VVKFCVSTKVDQFVFMSALVKVIVSMLTGYLLTVVLCVFCVAVWVTVTVCSKFLRA